MGGGEEWQLEGGVVTIRDNVVLRPARPWTHTVHALLAHLRAQGLSSVPEPLGIQDDVEALRLIPGDSGADAWPHQTDEQGLRSAAVLLREVHEASRGFVLPDGGEWAIPAEPGADVVCHGDPGPWNMVWDGPRAVGLIDWDLAHPAPAMDDVSYALEYLTPFRSDEVACDARRGHHFPSPPDRRARMQAYASAYGIPGAGGLVDRVIARQGMTIHRLEYLAERGVQPQRSWVESGHLDELHSRVRWTRKHRHLFE